MDEATGEELAPLAHGSARRVFSEETAKRLQSLLAGISAAGASIVTINQSTPENGAALVAVTIRTDTMQMTPEELTERLSRQRMVVGVHCGYNL